MIDRCRNALYEHKTQHLDRRYTIPNDFKLPSDRPAAIIGHRLKSGHCSYFIYSTVYFLCSYRNTRRAPKSVAALRDKKSFFLFVMACRGLGDIFCSFAKKQMKIFIVPVDHYLSNDLHSIMVLPFS